MTVNEVHSEIARRREKLINDHLEALDSYRARFVEFATNNPVMKQAMENPTQPLTPARWTAINEQWEAYLKTAPLGISKKFMDEWTQLDLSFVAPEVFPLLPEGEQV